MDNASAEVGAPFHDSGKENDVVRCVGGHVRKVEQAAAIADRPGEDFVAVGIDFFHVDEASRIDADRARALGEDESRDEDVGRWNEERIDADCGPCPMALTRALAGCELEHTTLKPSELSARDGYVLRLRCGNTAVRTHCDGENDGTNTSLCECERDGVRDAHVLKNLYPGEGPDSCLAAVVHCKTPRRKSPKLAD